MRSTRRLALALLIMGGLSAVAALFGPGEPWGVVDVGAVGAVLFPLILLAALWLFAWRGDQVFPEGMAIAERRALVGLVFLTVVLASFARQLWSLSSQGVVAGGLDDLFAHHYIQRLVSLLVAWALISHFLGTRVGGIEADERDLLLRHRADRAGDWALSLIVIAGVCVLASVPTALLEWWLSPIVLANVLIGLLIAKALVEHLVLTYAYRAARA